jgi:hypothetical protein
VPAKQKRQLRVTLPGVHEPYRTALFQAAEDKDMTPSRLLEKILGEYLEIGAPSVDIED